MESIAGIADMDQIEEETRESDEMDEESNEWDKCDDEWFGYEMEPKHSAHKPAWVENYKEYAATILSDAYYPLDGLFVEERQKLEKMPEKFLTQLSLLKKNLSKLIDAGERSRLDTTAIFQGIEKCIPMELYEQPKNKRQLMKLLNLILTRSAGECVFRSNLTSAFKTNSISWLRDIPTERQETVLQDSIILTLHYINVHFIYRLYYPIKVGRYLSIAFVPKMQWRRFLANVIDKLKADSAIERAFDKTAIGELYISPKAGLNNVDKFRPFVKLYKSARLHSSTVKATNSILKKFASDIFPINTGMFYDVWLNYITVIDKKAKLYGAKVDFTHCFYNIDLALLEKLITSATEVQINTASKEVILSKIQNQYVRFSKKEEVWLWKKGLLQGEQLSQALCLLYLAYGCNKNIKPILTSNCCFHQTVDDFLFCSTERSDVVKFLEAVNDICPVNKEKFQTNIGSNEENIIFEYCGKLINLETREVRILIDLKNKSNIHQRFNMWNYNEQHTLDGIIAEAMSIPANNAYFAKDFFNFTYNSQETAWDNFFTAMTYMAYKFDAVIMSVYMRRISPIHADNIEKHLFHNIVFYVNKMSRVYGHTNLLFKLSTLAFINVLKRRQTPVYKKLIGKLKYFASSHQSVLKFDDTRYEKISKQFNGIDMQRRFQEYV